MSDAASYTTRADSRPDCNCGVPMRRVLLAAIALVPCAATASEVYVWCGFPRFPTQTRAYEFVLDEARNSVRLPSGQPFGNVAFGQHMIQFEQRPQQIEKRTTRWGTEAQCRPHNTVSGTANLAASNNALYQWCSQTAFVEFVPGRHRFEINRMTSEFRVWDDELVGDRYQNVGGVIHGECRIMTRRF